MLTCTGIALACPSACPSAGDKCRRSNVYGVTLDGEPVIGSKTELARLEGSPAGSQVLKLVDVALKRNTGQHTVCFKVKGNGPCNTVAKLCV